MELVTKPSDLRFLLGGENSRATGGNDRGGFYLAYFNYIMADAEQNKADARIAIANQQDACGNCLFKPPMAGTVWQPRIQATLSPPWPCVSPCGCFELNMRSGTNALA